MISIETLRNIFRRSTPNARSRRPHAFRPMLDGFLEQRLALSGPGAPQMPFPTMPTVTTHTLYQVSTDIVDAFHKYANNGGTPAAAKSLVDNLISNSGRIPFGRKNLMQGLISDVQGLTPANAQQKSDKVVSHMTDYVNKGVAGGRFNCHQSCETHVTDPTFHTNGSMPCP
jgi:hypothetical protein